jgi:hypothetical protein
LLIACSVQAQDATSNPKKIENKKGTKKPAHKNAKELKYIEYGIGAGNPVGSFGSVDAGDEFAGYAKSGLHGFWEAAFLNRKTNFGYIIRFEGYRNTLNTDAFQNVLQLKTSQTVSVSSTSAYNTFCILTGYCIYIPADKITSVELKPLIGLSICRSADVTVDGEEDLKATLAVASAFGGNASCSFLMSPHFLGAVSIGYMHTEPVYNIDTNPVSNPTGLKLKQPTSIVSLSVGLGWKYF